jgi:putative ABC transport system permease protein
MLALRSLRKNPGITITVILLLGFGIGANTALFSLFRAILWQPIPGVRDSDRLVRVRRTQNGRVQGNQSYPDYLDFRDQSKTVQGLIAERLIPLRLAGPPAEIVSGAIVTGNYFDSLGAKAVIGRLLHPDDDRVPGGHPVVAISEAFWRRQFGADPRAIGSTLNLNGFSFTVVGVAAAPFEGVEYGEHTAIWMPMTMVKQAMTRVRDYHWLSERRAGWLTWYGRLRPGVALTETRKEWDAIAVRLEQAYPQTNQGRRFEVNANAAMSPDQRAQLSGLLKLLFGAVVLILVIACGNVANLMLTSAAARTREMAIRLALGADRGALVRQLLTESLALGLASGAVGLLLAPWIMGILGKVWRQEMPAAGVLDWRVLTFTLAISFACVLLCGLAPAWAASGTDVAAAIKDAGPQGGRGRGRIQRVFVVAQVALSVALVITSALVLGSMRRIVGIDPGFQPRGIVMATMDLSLLGYSPERGTEFFTDLVNHVKTIPGVRAASLGKSSPAVDWSDRVTLANTQVDRNIIAPGYFGTLGIPLIAGRDFTPADRTGAPQVAIVSQALAGRLWPGQNAIGRQVALPIEGRAPAILEIIGVAADSRYRSVLDAPPLLLYSPLLQNYDSIARLMVAVDGPAAEFKEPLRRAIQRFNPELPVRTVNTMQEQIEQSLWQRRAAAAVLSFFGALALVLACTGIHGVVAYTVAQRTREIGIRMALGALRGDVLRHVAAHAVRLALMGIALGVPLAMWSRPAVAAFLYRAEGASVLTFIGVAVLFFLVAVAASAVPARRAASIDPAIALRH